MLRRARSDSDGPRFRAPDSHGLRRGSLAARTVLEWAALKRMLRLGGMVERVLPRLSRVAGRQAGIAPEIQRGGPRPGQPCRSRTCGSRRGATLERRAVPGCAQTKQRGRRQQTKPCCRPLGKTESTDVPSVVLNHEPKDVVNSDSFITIVLCPGYGLDRMALMEQLTTKGVDSRPFFTPLSDIPAYRATEEAARARAQSCRPPADALWHKPAFGDAKLVMLRADR
jgi:hypothetical protein